MGNQSATLWNQMLGLSIPTVPNMTDYTTLQYAFTDGYNKYTISNYQSVDKEVDGKKYNAQVTYYYNQDTYKGVEAINTNPQVQSQDSNKTYEISYTLPYYAIDGVNYSKDEIANTKQNVPVNSSEEMQYLIANNMSSLPAGTTLARYSYTDALGVVQHLYGTNVANLKSVSYNPGTAQVKSTQELYYEDTKTFNIGGTGVTVGAVGSDYMEADATNNPAVLADFNTALAAFGVATPATSINRWSYEDAGTGNTNYIYQAGGVYYNMALNATSGNYEITGEITPTGGFKGYKLADGTEVNSMGSIDATDPNSADLAAMLNDAGLTGNKFGVYYYTDAGGTMHRVYLPDGTPTEDPANHRLVYSNANTIDENLNTENIAYSAGGTATINGNTVTILSNDLVDPNSAEYNEYISATGIVPDPDDLYKFTYQDNGTTYLAYYLQSKTTGDVTIEKNTAYTVVAPPTYMLGNTVATQYDPKDKEQKVALEQIRHDYPELAGVPDQNMYVYFKNGKMCFSTRADLDACDTSGYRPEKEPDFEISSPIDYQHKLKYYYAGNITQQIVEKAYAIMDDASGSGRFSTIKLDNMSEPFYLKSEEVTDEKSYNDAMNQYNYNVTQYEKAMADINAKTKIIQEQDRTLELRLKQLETEQKAIATEIDAVKGIIKSNIDASFKTFS